MKYILNEEYNLCGWKKVPYAIKNKKGDVIFLNKKAFDLLDACEGQIDFDIPLYSDFDRDYLKTSCENGLIREAKNKNDTRKINYVFYNNRYIDEVQFAVTGKCNFLCKHCYMSAHGNNAVELPLDKILFIIDEFKKAGVFKISLTGGECLIRNDFFDIIDKIIECDMNLTTIYSNAWLINDKLLDNLEKRNIKPRFSISFDGVGYHDYMRGIKGAEDKCDKVFKLLHKRGYLVDVEMCLFDKNKHTLRETIKYLDSVGVSYIKVNPVTRIGEWIKQDSSNDIELKEVFDLYCNYINEYFEDDLKNIDIQLSGLFAYIHNGNKYIIPAYKKCTNLDNLCVCGHARIKSYVTEEGVTLPCPSLSSYLELKNHFPSILKNGYAFCITESSTYMDFIDKKAPEIIAHNTECQNCEYKENCFGGCRASAYGFTKDLLGKDEGICMMLKSGYMDKVKKIMSHVRPDVKYVME